MKIITKIALLGALVISVSSCKLDLKPTYAMASDKAFETYPDAVAFANGMNSSFRSTIYGQYSTSSEVQMDMYNAAQGFGNVYGPPHTMGTSLTTSDYYIRDLWRELYAAILSTNNFLSGIDKVMNSAGVTDAEKQDMEVMKGNAHFYRAFFYHKLVRYYSPAYDAATAGTAYTGVPIVLEYNINEKPSRATLAATYAQILEDLKQAEIKLAGQAGEVRSIVPTIDAVKALKARVALFMKDYANAAKYADEVIQSGAAYKLCSTTDEMTAEWTNDNGTEDIMQLYASLSEYGESAGSRLANSAYLGYSAAAKKYVPLFIPTKTCIDMYTASDIRFTSWFSTLPCLLNGGNYNLVLLSKYPGNPELYQGVTNYAQKPKVFRVAEMYLIAAEAYLQTNAGLALERLNTLQTARGAAPTAATEATVRTEWAKETIGEGYRLDCMKRWGLGFTNRLPQDNYTITEGPGFNIISAPADDYHFVWAIPSEEIKASPVLEAQQNKGW